MRVRTSALRHMAVLGLAQASTSWAISVSRSTPAAVIPMFTTRLFFAGLSRSMRPRSLNLSSRRVRIWCTLETRRGSDAQRVGTFAGGRRCNRRRALYCWAVRSHRPNRSSSIWRSRSYVRHKFRNASCCGESNRRRPLRGAASGVVMEDKLTCADNCCHGTSASVSPYLLFSTSRNSVGIPSIIPRRCRVAPARRDWH